MQVRRVITAYLTMLALSLIIVAGRTAPEAPGATWTSQDSPAVNGADPALPSPEPATPTIEATQGPARPVRLDLRAEDIPLTALAAYRRAAAILAQVDPGCGLRWTLIAAIGRVESNHGQTVGATLDTDGMSRPAVDPAAHGLGPMRFLPSVWKVVAVDGDGDGRRVAEDIDDAALAAAVYLCAASTDLGTRSGMVAAVRGYNDAQRYVDLVLGYEKLYREGDFLVMASSGDVAPASIVLVGPRLVATPFDRPRPSKTARARIRAEARETMARVAQPGAPAGTASPSLSPSAKPPGGTEEPQTAEAPQPPSPAESDRGAPDTDSPTDGTTDPAPNTDTPNDGTTTDPPPNTDTPNDGTTNPAPQQPTDSGPDAPDRSPTEPASPEKPEPPKEPGTSPGVCPSTDTPVAEADPAEGDQTEAGEGAGDGTGDTAAQQAGSSGQDKAAHMCPEPDPDPCTTPDESATADPGADQGADVSTDPSSPTDETTCEPSPKP